MKISVDEKGIIIVDENVIDIKAINSEFLRKIFLESLRGNVEYEISEGHPIATLFKQIEDETSEESVFYSKWKKEKENFEKNNFEIESIEKEIEKLEEKTS